MIAKIRFLLIRGIFRLFSLLPPRLTGGLGAGIGRLFYLLDKKHRTYALQNLARIYPQKPEHWRKRVARESFAELGRTLFELPHVFLRSKAFLLSRVEIEGEETFREVMAQGKGAFLTACHHSNWELGALMFSILGYSSAIIYRPMNDRDMETYLKACRERFGAVMQSRMDGLRWLPRALRDNRPVAVMIDQHMSQGMLIPFLGHPASTTTLPAVFILKQQTPVFGVTLDRIGRSFRFRLRFWPIGMPDPIGDKTQDSYAIMKTICDEFGPVIHRRPELWLWPHRRWLALELAEAQGEVAHGAS